MFERRLARLALGGDSYVVHARAVDRTRVATAAVVGRGEADATGRVAAAVVRRLVDRRVPAGVHHLDAVVDPTRFVAEVGLEVIVPDPIRPVESAVISE